MKECIKELIRVYDESVLEIFSDITLSDDEKLNLDLFREGLIASIIDKNEIKSEEDEKYVIDNIELYKRFFKAMIVDNEKEMKVIVLEMLKIKNNI